MSSSYAEDLQPLIEDEPPEVQKAIRRAIRLLEEDDGPQPAEALHTLVKLGSTAAAGTRPSGALIVEAIAALLTLGRTVQQKHRAKVAQSRRKGTAAGLAAYQASKAASASARAQKQAQGAAAAYARTRFRNVGRDKKTPKTPLK